MVKIYSRRFAGLIIWFIFEQPFKYSIVRV